ncbi:MAG: CBS domain-containing protein [Candidatus Rokubacteria bacterium]|nr:CBS domain-containing protein [Candidatus Rokubacteria bacterium]
MGEFEDEDSAALEGDLREVRGALLNDTIALLGPAEPILLAADATVADAVEAMLGRRQAAVLVTDGQGRLAGIFTERDVLNRVVGRGLDAGTTAVRDVMTPRPEALTARDRVAYAIHCMSVAGYRTIPLVDAAQRPVGIVTVNDVIRWLASLFPEAVLNLPPGDSRLKRPQDQDAG